MKVRTDTWLVSPVSRFDAAAVSWCAVRRRPVADAIMRLAARVGDGPLWFAGSIVRGVVARDGAEILRRLLVAHAFELSPCQLLKKALRRPRPFAALAGVSMGVTPPDELSFPSGHTAAAFVFMIVSSAPAPAILPFLLPVAVRIGASRVWLGGHYPTDVIAGASLRAGCAWLGMLLWKCVPATQGRGRGTGAPRRVPYTPSCGASTMPVPHAGRAQHITIC